MSGSLVADLGISPEAWLFLSILSCMTVFFKFGRFWSIRNLDLLLLFALSPGMMLLVAAGGAGSWWAYSWLFVGSLLWIVRCGVDLGLARRPVLEPNLTASGLACLMVGIVGLFVFEMANLPIAGEAPRNPADPRNGQAVDLRTDRAVADDSPEDAPIDPKTSAAQKPWIILRRVLAMFGQVGLIAALIWVGWRHFERPIAGLSAATCYLLLPYARFALVDSGQLIPSALIVVAVACFTRPVLTGLLVGVAAGWMPACLGLLPLWAGFYRQRGFWRFSAAGGLVTAACAWIGYGAPLWSAWFRSLGARSWSEAGVWPGVDALPENSFWSGIDPNYRLPVQIAYLILVVLTTLLPFRKNLGELIALSATLLAASQFWYLEAGGALVILYLPLVILMMFRPNLGSKQANQRMIKQFAMSSSATTEPIRR